MVGAGVALATLFTSGLGLAKFMIRNQSGKDIHVEANADTNGVEVTGAEETPHRFSIFPLVQVEAVVVVVVVCGLLGTLLRLLRRLPVPVV